MGEWKLQRRVGELGAVCAAHRFDPFDAGHDRRRRHGIIIMRPGPRAGGENAGIEHPSEQNAQSLACGGRQKLRQRRLLQQRIAPRQQHDVEITGLSEALTHLGLVDADADGRNRLGVP